MSEIKRYCPMEKPPSHCSRGCGMGACERATVGLVDTRTSAERAIFLDIDGVLNHPGTYSKYTGMWNQDRENVIVPVEAECIVALNELVERSGASIVISSSWRHFAQFKYLGQALERHGVRAEFVGETPYPSDARDRVAKYGMAEYGERHQRGMDIYCYLRDHPEIEEFVILDDGDDMWRLQPALVLTDAITGLTLSDVERALTVLSTSRDLIAHLHGETPP